MIISKPKIKMFTNYFLCDKINKTKKGEKIWHGLLNNCKQ